MKLKGIRFVINIDTYSAEELKRSDFVYEIIDDLNAREKSDPVNLIRQMRGFENFKYLSRYSELTDSRNFDVSEQINYLETNVIRKLKLARDNTIFHQQRLLMQNKYLFEAGTKFPDVARFIMFEGILTPDVTAAIEIHNELDSNFLFDIIRRNLSCSTYVFLGTKSGNFAEREELYRPAFLRLLKNYSSEKMAALTFDNDDELTVTLALLSRFLGKSYNQTLASFGLIQNHINSESIFPFVQNVFSIIKDSPDWVISIGGLSISFEYKSMSEYTYSLSDVANTETVVEFLQEARAYLLSKTPTEEPVEEGEDLYDYSEEYEEDEDDEE